MASSIDVHTAPGGVAALWHAPDLPGLGLAWLGQAGFALRTGGLRMLIDPYLSNYLEEKYRGSERPHDRLVPSAGIETFDGVDLILCTHQHGDHMDPIALPALAARNPACQVIVPRASLEHAANLGVHPIQLTGVDAGEKLPLGETCSLKAVAAAHETLERNERGEHRFLGYIVHAGELTIYHSGDSVLFPALAPTIVGQGIDLALLPVNGRGKGVAGNFTFQEAAELCHATGIPYLIPHHFGMFAFNTVDRLEVAEQAAGTAAPRCLLPDPSEYIILASFGSGS